jgi:hypothetical protein
LLIELAAILTDRRNVGFQFGLKLCRLLLLLARRLQFLFALANEIRRRRCGVLLLRHWLLQ